MQYNYFNYINEKFPPYGSVVYFAYRKISDEKKENLYLLDQLKSQLISCIELYNNPEVTVVKTQWWIDQVNKLLTDENVSSPQLKKLATIFDKKTLHEHLSNDLNHALSSHSNEDNFISHAQNNFLGIEILKASILNESDAIDLDTIKQINTNNEIVRNIFCIPKHYTNNIINNKHITNNMSKDDLNKVIEEWMKSYRNITNNKTLKPLIKINQIHRKMLKKYQKEISNPFVEAIDFSPLSLLFYSV